MIPKYKSGDAFSFCGVECHVNHIATFSGESHYGVTYSMVMSSGDSIASCGFLPVRIVDDLLVALTAWQRDLHMAAEEQRDAGNQR